jgi:RNA polymerase sigma-70 factor (ECF subfamily)
MAMVALAEGDRGAFDRVFSTLWPVLHRVSVRMLGATAEAEDAAQQALCKLLGEAWRLDAERDALPWALTFVINECRTARNRARRKVSTELDAIAEPTDPAASPEDDLIGRELLEALEDAVGELGPSDREALGLTAGLESLPAPTRRKRRQRALSRLRVAWRKLYGSV